MTYQDILVRIFALQDYGLEIFSIGKSTLGREIYGTHVGSFAGPQVIIQGGIHAREFISTLLTIELAQIYADTPQDNGGIYFIFCTNPDGVALVLDGLESVRCDITRQYLTLVNQGNTDFSLWKANINAVDLNTNFNALWGTGSQNVFCPASEDFVGFYPESEREVKVLTNFTLKNRAKLTISYHSKGEVIYYGFAGESENDVIRDRQIGEKLSQTTGYPLIFTENSSGGYKDWCIMELKIPSYTIEVGRNDVPHPIGEEYLPEIVAQNRDVPRIALDAVRS
ncbi:MAG: M14 family zinc carboxypeptidase [Clostridia bacterium]